jgi:glutamyl-tRNA reductase
MSPPGLKDFALVGLSHKSAPVEVREKLSVTADEMPRFLAELRAADGVEELLLISTCNRVETYAWGASDLFEGVRGVFSQRAGPAVLGSLYDRRGRDAVSHLFRVSSSLDSMVLGEPQILGQVKEAFAAAQQAGTLGGVITGACQAAFSAAKRVRSETAIGAAPVSMASAAVELSRKIFGSLTGRTVLLVGAADGPAPGRGPPAHRGHQPHLRARGGARPLGAWRRAPVRGAPGAAGRRGHRGLLDRGAPPHPQDFDGSPGAQTAAF